MRKIIEEIDLILNKERGSIRKEHGGRIRICLIYPNVYKIGIGNLGFQTVYRLFNERKDVVCERSFLPSFEILSHYKNFPLLSIESKTPLIEFDILAFSLCFENDLPNVLKILKLSKIPILAVDRESEHPLIIAGGILCYSNPEPFADIFDIILIGEAEELVNNFIDTYKKVIHGCESLDWKKVLKRELIGINGFYVPEAYEEIYDKMGNLVGRKSLWNEAPEKVRRVYCKDFSKKFSFSQILTEDSVFPQMFLVEAMRGCPFSCRFCLVGHVYNPPRKASFEILKDRIEHIRNCYNCNVGIIAPSPSAYTEIKDLLKIQNVEISSTSFRADSHTIEILQYLRNRKTLTLAPEAGSERLRNVLKKKISEEDLLLISEKVSEIGIENLKLYFMIGLPFEEDEDIDAIVNLLVKIRKKFQRKITASVSIFVPKPFTPFQWHGMEDEGIVKERLRKLKKDTTKIKGFRLLHEVPKYSYMQGFLAKANRRGIEVIKRISEGENFNRIFDEVRETVCSIRDFKDFLPWDFIEHEGLTREYLWQEYKRAESEAKKGISQQGNSSFSGARLF